MTPINEFERWRFLKRQIITLIKQGRLAGGKTEIQRREKELEEFRERLAHVKESAAV